eukprot:9484652-Pyramimonas_sp.AAC.1
MAVGPAPGRHGSEATAGGECHSHAAHPSMPRNRLTCSKDKVVWTSWGVSAGRQSSTGEETLPGRDWAFND